jgi:hypothetical protein
MKKEDPSAYLDIFREFEAVKRTVSTDKEGKVKMTIPRALLDIICKKHLQEDFELVVQSSTYHDKIILRYDKMRIDTILIIDMFKQASERIIELISDVLKKMKGSNDYPSWWIFWLQNNARQHKIFLSKLPCDSSRRRRISGFKRSSIIRA